MENLESLVEAQKPHKWYIVHTYSNFEARVADSIREHMKVAKLEEEFSQVLVPTEEVVALRRGKRVETKRKFFPGYVLVKMNLTDETYHLIKSTPKVSGFLGAQSKPTPIPQAQIDKILNQVEEGVESLKPSVIFEVGEQVRVIDGPFASFNGFVEESDEKRARLKVSVSIFGRATPVELEYVQVEKI